MEGSYWLRLGAIVALFFGALYVLAPTALQDAEVDVADSAVVELEDRLQVWFDTEPEQAQAIADIAEQRLTAMAFGFERVSADRYSGRVEVFLAVGSDKRVAEAVVTMPGNVALYDASVLGDGSLDDLPGLKVPAEATPVSGTVVSLGADRATLEGAADSLLYVALDGRLVAEVAAASEPGAAERSVRRLSTGVIDGLEDAVVNHGALPASIQRYKPPVVETVEEDETVVEVVEWYEPFLLDYKLSLGLDLQGGVDMTLQVDLEETVLSQVRRDRTTLLESARRDNKTLDVQRDRSQPVLRIGSEEGFSALKSWLSEQLSDYDYVETLNDEGTTRHVYRIDPAREQDLQKQAVEQVLETLRKRVDATGVKEPSIVKLGGGRINVQLPGVADAQQAIDTLGTQAVLEFFLVDPKSDPSVVERLESKARKALPPEQFEDDDLVNDWLREQGDLPDDRRLMWQYNEIAAGELQRAEVVYVVDKVVLTGADVNDAGVGFEPSTNQPQVSLSFKPRGAQIFCEFTSEHVNDNFAIVLDGQVRSYPSIRDRICGGRASISMGSSLDALDEARQLALVLRTGSLNAPVEVGQVREIGSSLGQDAIEGGTIATLIGGSLTLMFMLMWYGRPGFIADIALVLNVLLVFALLAMLGATLTLPGIAGVALTVGMAVDANIIVYERIREELKHGVPARRAVETGYEKAVVAVLDANVTTAIAGVVLFSYGTGPIKGFAVTLLIGIFTTLVTALFVTRTFMEIATRNSNSRLRI